MSTINKEIKRVTTHILRNMKMQGEKISMLTAYDYSMARIIDDAGIDVILVGDSASNVVHGHETTLPITLTQIIDHASSVVRGIKRCLVVVDLPFGYYQGDSKVALKSAIRIMKESGAHAIPVMGHFGLAPQSIYNFGTYTVRAQEPEEASILIEDSIKLQKAGCFALVLEKIPQKLAEEVTRGLDIPTIGIGAGPGCDGQVLVTHDMLGINKDFSPRFLRRYANLYEVMKSAFEHYIEDVKTRSFPDDSESY